MNRSGNQPKIIDINEWGSVLIDGFRLTHRDRAFLDRLLSTRKASLSVDELLTGTRITTSSWVGIIRFEKLEIRIHPKLAGDNVGLVRMIDYAAGFEGLTKSIGNKKLPSDGDSLLELIVFLFVESCERLLSRGLWYDYIETEDTLPTIRGRMLYDRQILKRYGQIDKIECRYEEHTSDILENQIIAAALEVLQRRIINDTLRFRANKLKALFQDVCSLGDFQLSNSRDMISYNRLNEHYREAHQLAWLIFDALGINDLYSNGAVNCFAFLLNMNALFERFLQRWVSDLLAGSQLKVLAKKDYPHSVIWDAVRKQSYAKVIPDILIQQKSGEARKLAIDAKYKLYDQQKVGSNDIYQLFLYAYAYQVSQGDSLPTSLLIYPSKTPETSHEHLQIKKIGNITSASIKVVGLHIPSALDDIEHGLQGQLSMRFSKMLRDETGVVA